VSDYSDYAMQASNSAGRLRMPEDWSTIDDDVSTDAPATGSSTAVENEARPEAIRSVQREDDLKLLDQDRETGHRWREPAGHGERRDMRQTSGEFVSEGQYGRDGSGSYHHHY
jgi:hypothetical protein